jgi:LPXTG-motif cell wall-anchored protein
VLTFDVNALQVVDDDVATAGTQIKPGPLFTTPAATNSVDTVAGKITYDTGTLTPAYSGHGVLASVTFKALASGITRPPFVFNSSAIIASDGSNILDAVNDGTYTISGTGGTTTTNTSNATYMTNTTNTATTQTSTILPQTGAVENTLILVGLGGGFLLISWVLRKKMI